MVYKVSKGGVRSGNTLRGLRSLRTRRYSRHACLVGRSSLPRKDITSLMDSATEDTLISSTLGSTGVILSLNKKQRWRLPSTVNHMIKAGNFKGQKTMVSLLERHKLKRRANCVSFVCNSGRIRHVTPKQKRYFSFKLDNIDEEQSNRQKRRVILEEMKKLAVPKKQGKKNKEKPFHGKIINAYTLDGILKESQPERLHSSKPEYRLEVFYPCPKTCSLAYNPKYTDVVMEVNEDGDMEIRSNKKGSKSQRQHRKRFTSKDVEGFDSEAVCDDVENMWKEMDEEALYAESELVSSVESIHGPKVEDVEIVSSDNTAEWPSIDECEVKEPRKFENLWSSLIAQAERAKALCTPEKQRRRKKSTRCSKEEDTACTRSHIVFTDEFREISHPVSIQKSEPSQVPSNTNHPDLQSARVILTSVETSPVQLKEKFGSRYAEAESEPRRFVIDVTDDIQNLLSSTRSAAQNFMYTSYLVFIFDGCYDEGLDTFKVVLNSNITKHTKTVSQAIPFEESSIDEIMNRVVCVLMDMKEDNLLESFEQRFMFSLKTSTFDLINQHLKVRVQSFHTPDEIVRVMNTDKFQEKSSLTEMVDTFDRDLEIEMFCGICYESVNPSQLDAVAGTQLTGCSHRFCDECWRSHFHAKMRNGDVKMECPGYQCDNTVGLVTLLSLLHVSEVGQLWQRKCEEEVEISRNSKWCPNPHCGRVIRLDTDPSKEDTSLDVQCSCGTGVCFACLSQPHWPASCEQAEEYTERLPTLKLPKEIADEFHPAQIQPVTKPEKIQIMEVEGRICPNCSRFIEKNGGCPCMVCKCGSSFCWSCMKSFSTHLNGMCFPDPHHLYRHTRRVRVKHVKIPTLSEETKDKQAGTRQKVTLYQKALQHRVEAKSKGRHNKQIKDLVRKIGKISHKDLSAKIEFLRFFGVVENVQAEETLRCLAVAPHALRFLNSCQEIHQALLHVAEYTFVLLQDFDNSLDKRRARRLADDLSGYCSFIKSVLELGDNQDARTAIKRLVDLQTWTKRGICTLLPLVQHFRQ